MTDLTTLLYGAVGATLAAALIWTWPLLLPVVGLGAGW